MAKPPSTASKFLSWFEGSRVRDEAGEPLVVYRGEHGVHDGQSFHSRSGSLAFGSASAASLYATNPNQINLDAQAESPVVIPAYLRVRQPLIDTPDDPFIDLATLRAALGEDQARRIALKFSDWIENTGRWQEDFADDHPDVKAMLRAATAEELDGFYFEVYALLDDPVEVALLKAAGFDGAIYGGSGANALEPEYRIFSTEQALPAIEVGWPTRADVAAPARPAPVARAKPASSLSNVKKVRSALSELVGANAVKLGEGLGRLVVTTSKELTIPGYFQLPPGAMASFANNPAFRQMLADQRAAKQRAIEAVGEVQDCAIVRHSSRDHQWQMILRDASEQGKWRTQSFDLKGFSGHMVYDTKQAAIEAAATQGFTLRDDAALDRIQDSPSFQRGLYVTDLIGRVNSGRMKYAEADALLAKYDETARVLNSIASVGAQAFIAAGGETIYLLADRIEVGQEKAVFLHEIVHRHGRKVLGGEVWSGTIKTLKGWASWPSASVERQIFDSAQARARQASPAGGELFDEELFAYAVEEAVSRGVKPSAESYPDTAPQWLDSVTGILRAAMMEVLGTDPRNELDAQGVVDLAYAFAQLESPERVGRILAALAPQERAKLAALIGREGSPVWYSALEQRVRLQGQPVMPARQWVGWFNAQAEKGIKPDEIQWSGVCEWLALMPEKKRVSREQVVSYLQANGVKVEEVILGGNELPPSWTLKTLGEGRGFHFAVVDDKGHEKGVGDTPAAAIESAQDLFARFTKYGKYTLQGGTGCREVLLKLPEPPTAMSPEQARARSDELAAQHRERHGTDSANLLRTMGVPEAELGPFIRATELGYGTGEQQKAVASELGIYKSSHWDHSNVLAHVRLMDRLDVNGKRVLFVEELQSDWGQEGKRSGFRDASQSAWDVFVAQGYTVQDMGRYWMVYDYNGDEVSEGATRELAIQDLVDRDQNTGDVMVPGGGSKTAGVPVAPFVGSTGKWLSLALKRVVRLAVDGNYDSVAFVNGEQSADRYEVCKRAKAIDWTSDGADRIVTITPTEGNDIEFRVTADARVRGIGGADSGTEFDGRQLSDVVGKPVAEAIWKDRSGSLSGDGLLVGGEGMRAFYDQIVPAAIKDVLKWAGGELTDISVGQLQPGFRVTPAMREQARMGMPLFSLAVTSALANYAERGSLDLESAQAQCAAVVARHAGSSGWMKAPNGMPTALTQDQWILVRTENFLKWFGDWLGDPESASEAVHPQTREPLVVYHGSPKAGFAEFDMEKRSNGHTQSMFFTSDRSVAKGYAGRARDAEITIDEDGYYDAEPGIYGVFLNLRKPWTEDFEGANWDGTRHGQWVALDEDGVAEPDQSGRLYFDDKEEARKHAESTPGLTLAPAPSSYDSTNDAVAQAKTMGSDGCVIHSVSDPGPFDQGYGDLSTVYVVFNGRQVKSATDNDGSFDPQSWDIRYSVPAECAGDLDSQREELPEWVDPLPAPRMRA